MYVKYLNKKYKHLFDREIEVYKMIREHGKHPNILKMYKYNTNELYLKKCDGDLSQFYKNFDKGYILTSVINATIFLHSIGIIHADIKPENIMVKGYEIYLGDFDSSEFRDNKIKNPRIQCGIFRAPEVVNLDNPYYDHKVDIWSIGALCIYLEDLEIERSRLHELSKNVIMITSSDFNHIIKHTIRFDPFNRKEAHELLK